MREEGLDRGATPAESLTVAERASLDRTAPGLGGWMDGLLGAAASDDARERLLARRAAEGDPRAREALLVGLMPELVVVARRYAGGPTELSDLVQEGALAALTALLRFDPERGTSFRAYAAPWIRGAMGRLAQDQRRALRLPARAKADLSSLKRAGNRLMAERGREAPLRDVAGAAGVDLDRAEAILNAARPAGSLEQPLGDDETLTLVDVLADPRAEGAYDDVVREAAAPQLGALLRALSEREREVVERRHGLGDRDEESLAEIGRRLGVSRERARQIEARALAKMRLVDER
ncbi:MAG TPA: sigma-70 family RNA polymerase sigma factor [Miltoncostaeaceae bacterium]|jgi:RNA polymerase primary sigma factor|nr:sigma-70 family RNA polymerase sigma factor [Miltoncostaeaceae bacterium]